MAELESALKGSEREVRALTKARDTMEVDLKAVLGRHAREVRSRSCFNRHTLSGSVLLAQGHSFRFLFHGAGKLAFGVRWACVVVLQDVQGLAGSLVRVDRLERWLKL